MNQSATITIVCVCDNHYAMLLAALIKSIEANHHTPEKLEFYIVDDNISKKNRLKLSASINADTTTIHWKPMRDCIPKGTVLPTDKSSSPLNIYVRLFIPFFVSPGTERVIFLDVDMIMLEDISKLWYTDLQTNIVGAVQDQFIQIVSRWGGISNYEQFGYTKDSKYFNAGLMLMDIKKWQANDISNKVLKCLAENKEHAQFQDQYGLNAILGHHWLELDPLWNRFAYSEDKNPYLIHFTGRKPIYETYNFSEDYREIFLSYLRQTAWTTYKPIGETRRYLKKFTNILQKARNLIPRK
ncbi:glycosyltransferase family 8 protein [Parapedobacter koreensis]|uniref:Lipopolysaccharide biosynthesis protein, LPS:glycosyltransferase n=1 Tax=Parapedobacter koreensis TaxID=332977 RepID=A0A1H7IIZ3_9SPHI|nr:glycosyltransferase family 8 protein [Parapedobacter koreensis]SEK61812.1 Lipopolysaccharide biosynthesis protein, LPS:glycosyltransferase [Parapedobacter koreensis]